MRVRVEQVGVEPSEYTFISVFRIGRGMECDLRIDSGLVSRIHAEVVFEDGSWWVRDAGSTNGLVVHDERTPKVRLDGPVTVQLGRNAPTLHFSLEEADGREAAIPLPVPTADPVPGRSTTRRARTMPQEVPPPDRPSTPPSGDFVGKMPASFEASGPAVSGSDPSVSQVIRRYFDDDPSQPAGEHTMMIRRAYVKVKEKQKRKYIWVIAGVLGLLLVAMGLIVNQELRIQRMRGQAATFFKTVKEIELSTAELRYRLQDDEELAQRMAQQERQRRQQRVVYEGYVEELGLYRKLTDEEKDIYRVARIFNESEFEMPAGFVGEVRRVMNEYWLSPAGKSRYERAIRNAERNGYTPVIVQTMQAYGLPPEFFYLALQESNLDPSVYGIATRWGIAKGMWQFIPSTARQYGLQTGPREDVRMTDPQDDRHDFVKSTEAAAKYLLYIYSTPAQASGLLVMASYNWGEHRVIKKLQDLPTSHDVFAVAFEGIPEDLNARVYWRFLVEYKDRMPDETKDYVLKIFSAAVIGQNPRRYGFDFDNPLKPYMEAPLTQAMPSPTR